MFQKKKKKESTQGKNCTFRKYTQADIISYISLHVSKIQIQFYQLQSRFGVPNNVAGRFISQALSFTNEMWWWKLKRVPVGKVSTIIQNVNQLLLGKIELEIKIYQYKGRSKRKRTVIIKNQ